jgi:hypothetical protein
MLHTGESPGQGFNIAWLDEHRDYAVFVPFLLKCVQQLPLHPFGSDCRGRKGNQEPVTSLERFADLIVPLLSSYEVPLTVPEGYFSFRQKCRELVDERAVRARVRKE